MLNFKLAMRFLFLVPLFSFCFFSYVYSEDMMDEMMTGMMDQGEQSIFSDEQNMPEVSGYVEMSFNHNVSRSTDNVPFRFDLSNQGSFILNDVSLGFSGNLYGYLDYAIELGYAFDTEASKHAFDIGWAYFVYTLPRSTIDVKFGKFLSLQGFEVVEPHNNFVASRGYLYSIAESTDHIGFLASVGTTPERDWFTSRWFEAAVKTGLVNSIDGSPVAPDSNDDPSKRAHTSISQLQLGFTEYLFGSFVLYYGDSDDLDRSKNGDKVYADTTWVLNTVYFELVGQYTYGEDDGILVSNSFAKWSGLNVQAKFNFNRKKTVSLSFRYEYLKNDSEKANIFFASDDDFDGFIDKDKIEANKGIRVDSYTVSFNFYLLDGLLVRSEYRFDQADDDIRLFSDPDAVEGFTDSISTIGVQMVVVF